jgi:polyhydroxybutyrate depolymerase
LVPYPNDPPRDEIVRRWAAANLCEPDPVEVAVPPDVEHETYSCPTDDAVEMYVVDDGGHTWPGSTPGPYSEALGGKTTQTIDATALIWAFFSQHARGG